MTKLEKNFVNSGQMGLFDWIVQEKKEREKSSPGYMNISSRLNASLKQAIRNAPKSRETIADDMSDMLGIEVTASMLNNYTSISHPHRIPAEWIPAFCIATKCNEPLQIISEATGVFTLPSSEALRAEIQRMDEEVRKLQTEKKKRLLFLQELGER